MQISVPETFFIQAPDQGGVAVGDGETFTIGDGATAVTFEFDSDSNLDDTNNTGIAFSSGSTDNDIAEAIINAINNAALGLTPVNLGGGRVHLGSAANHTLSVFGPGVTGGGVAGSLVDGDTFTITNSAGTHTFEFDNDQQFGLTNTIIDSAPGLTHLQLAQAINDAILSVDLGITPLVLSGGIIEMEGDDEDGVVFGGAFNPFIDTPITVTASGAGLLDAWIDFNRDGDFFDPGEKIFNSEALVRGVNELAVRTPTSFVPGDSFARFRFSTLGGLTSTGLAASGEVEGYVVTLRDGTPPVAIDDPEWPIELTTTEDVSLSVATSVLSNDFDADFTPFDPLTDLTVFNAGTLTSRLGAVVDLNADGTFDYDPTTVLGAELQALAFGASVVDTFTYRAFDGFLFSELATVSILVTGENDVPVARRLDIAADEDGIPVNGSFRGDDPDSDDDQLSLTYTVTDTVSEGVLTNNNFSIFTFDPGSDFQNLAVGEIRQVFFEYTATDRFNETSAAATGTVIVTGVNDAPTVSDMLVGAVEDGVAVTASFDGDDIDSDDNQASLRYEVFGFPTEGTFVNNVDGTFTFDPGNDFQDLGVGETRDITILYHAIDSNLVTSNLASLTIRVTGTNDAPNAVDDPTFQNGYGTTEDNPISIANPAAGLLVNDSDPDLFDTLVVDGAPLVITSMFGASATVQPNGTFVYDPTSSPVIQALNVGDSLDDNFIYTVTDGNGGTDSATAVIAVAGRNDAPVAADVLVAAEEDGPPVTANFNGDDADAEDGPTQLTYAFVPFSGPSEGTIENNGNGTFTFDPGSGFQDLAPGATREVIVHYQAIDSRGTVSQNGTITIVVTGVNDAPTAVDDNGGFNARNGSTIIDLLGNDFDVDGSTLDDGSIVIVTPPTNGAVTVNGDGTVTYASTGSFGGSDSFSYQMMDDEGLVSLLSNVADVTIVTTDLPTANDAIVTTAEGTPIEIDILAITNDVDGSIDPASIEIISGPSNGAAIINHFNGSITYQPTPEYLGQDLFEYRVRDNVGAPSNIATITIEVVENLVPYRNPRNRFDVNDDGVVTPLDLLLVITFLNKNGASEPFGPRPPYLDVTFEDNFINLLDALAVITELRQLSLGEGEARLPAAMQPIDFSSLGNVSSTESVQQPLVQDSSQSTDEMLRR
ncbi:MAG: Ig-like domain-containing protein, partial [Pirellulaceae bacterium]